MQVLVGAAGAGALLLQLAALHQLVLQEPRVGRNGAVAHVLAQQRDQQVLEVADLAHAASPPTSIILRLNSSSAFLLL